jgi:hypothetical protein
VTSAVLAAPVVRAIQDQKVSPGVLGFLVVAALGVATWLLIRSMNRQLHKIDFSEDAIDLERKKSAVADTDLVVDAGAPQPEPDASASAVVDGDDGPGSEGDRQPE